MSFEQRLADGLQSPTGSRLSSESLSGSGTPREVSAATEDNGTSDDEDLFSDDSDIPYEDARNIRPVWYANEGLHLRDIIDVSIGSGTFFMPAHRLASLKAAQARTADEFWRSGTFNLLGIPFVKTSCNVSAATSKAEVLRDTLDLPAWSTRKNRRHSQAQYICSEDSIRFTRCCACAGHYEYDLGDQKPVYVCAGIPDGNYAAISYVWGSVKDLDAVCASCGYISRLPMESNTKFHNIMSVAGPGNCVWLDALSIDQADHADIARQISKMGSIYKKARSVVVLLPDSDLRAFELLQRLSRLAEAILGRPAHFHLNYEDAEAAMAQHSQRLPEEFEPGTGVLFYSTHSPFFPAYGPTLTSELCNDFCNTFYEFRNELPNFKYWQRAWTFQEWAMAQDIHVGIGERQVRNVKTSIFSAASLICQYVLAQGEYREIKTELNGDAAIRFFAEVKRLFPFEDILRVPGEVTHNERRKNIRVASRLGADALNLRKTPRTEMKLR